MCGMTTAHSLPLLYSFRRCPYAMRARLALASSGLSVALREVVLRDKPAHMLEISPKGTVPVLLLPSGELIDESLDIMFWALAQADPEQLLPTEKAQLQIANSLIALNDGAFKHGLDRYKYPPRYTDEHADLSPEAFAAQHRDAAANALLVELNQRLSQHEYLLGSRLSVADIAIAPFVRQYAHTDINWFKAQDWPHLLSWLQRFLDSARFKQIMLKYKQWHEGDEATLFPPALT